MRRTVVDLEELKQAKPFFRNRFGFHVGKKLMKWLCIDKVNQVYRNSCISVVPANNGGLDSLIPKK